MSECPLSKYNGHFSAPILILWKRNSHWGGLNLANMEGDSTVPFLFLTNTARRSLQCVDTHYRGEERTSDLSTFLASHGQYACTNSPELEYKMWHSQFDLQVHIRSELHLCSQKTKQHRLYPWFLKPKFFGGWCIQKAPFGTLALYFRIICKTPALVDSNYRVQKVWVAFLCFNKVVSMIKARLFLFGCQCMWHKLHTEFPFL